MLQAEGIWRAKVVLTGRPMEGSVLSLMRTHKHLGLLAFTFVVFSQHSGVGFFAVPLTNGMQAATVAICSAHSFSSSSIVATDAMANEATTIQNTISFLLLIFLCFSGFLFGYCAIVCLSLYQPFNSLSFFVCFFFCFGAWKSAWRASLVFISFQ